jgi:putative peptide zinc metalloprotease protein
VRAQTDGFVQSLARPDGSRVAAGELLLQLADEQLVAERDAARERVAGLEARWYASWQAEPGRTGALAAQTEAARSALQRLEERVASLNVAAPSAGQLVMPRAANMADRWVHRGDTLAHVLPDLNTVVRVAVPQDAADLVTQDLKQVELRTLDAAQRVVPAAPHVKVAAASHRLPAAALGAAAGGQLVVDASDPEGQTTRDPISVFDLQASQSLGERVGTRVAVRFIHSPQPLLWQISRGARQLLLRQFRPGE